MTERPASAVILGREWAGGEIPLAPKRCNRNSVNSANRYKPSKSKPFKNWLSKLAQSKKRRGSQNSECKSAVRRLCNKRISSTPKNKIEKKVGSGCNATMTYGAIAESPTPPQKTPRQPRARRKLTTASASLNAINRMGTALKPRSLKAAAIHASTLQL